MAEVYPELWPDFDGTGVVKLSKRNPRTWLKYPLDAIAGYSDFVRGVGEAGVLMGGIVSLRPDILPRRFVTRRSMRKHGYDQLFPGPDQVILAGSEAAKATHLVERSHVAPVCMIDDNPHKIGKALVAAMLEKPGGYPILLGAADNPQNKLRYEQLSMTIDWEDWFGPYRKEVRAEQFAPRGLLGESNLPGIDVRIEVAAGSSALQIVQLPTYSLEAGREFGGMMLQMAA